MVMAMGIILPMGLAMGLIVAVVNLVLGGTVGKVVRLVHVVRFRHGRSGGQHRGNQGKSG